MPVIDLQSGKITKSEPSLLGGQVAPQETATQSAGRIIDLDTGKFVEPQTEQAEPQQEPAKPLSQIIPEAAQSVGETVQQVPEIGIGEMFTGSQRIAATPELGELPEFAVTPEGDRPDVAVGFLSTFNQKAQQDIIQEAIPEAVFETTADGSVIIEVPTKEGGTRRSVLNRPGFSPQDLATTTAQILSFVPAAKIASLFKTLGRKIGVGALTAGTTEQALQEVGVEIGRKERDPVATGVAAVGGAIGEAIVPAVQAVRQSRQAAKLGVEAAEIAAAKKSIEPARQAVAGLEEATGKKVSLFQAQQTQIPSEQLKQRILPQLDAGSRKAAAALEAQNKEAFEATSELINTIAGPEVAETGAKRFRTAAQTAIDAVKESRAAATSGIYKEAFKAGANVNLQGVEKLIKRSLERAKFGGKLKSSMEKIGGLVGRPTDLSTSKAIKTRLQTPTLDQLQNAKFEIDAMLEDVGSKALDTTTKRAVLKVQKELVKAMEDASPLYKQANEEFRALSPSVEALEESIVGAVSKVSDVNLQNISRRIFSPNSNPAVVKSAKKVIDDVDPGAWDDMLRTELQRRFGGIESLAEDIPGELVGNVPGQLRKAIFGNPEQRRTLLSAMSLEQKKNFVFLDEVLRRASSGRAAGSPTASFGQAIENLKGVGGILRDAIFRPLKTLQETGERSLFDRNVAALTDVMFDPSFKPQLAKIRSLDPNGPEAGTLLKELLDISKASATAEAKALREEEQ